MISDLELALSSALKKEDDQQLLELLSSAYKQKLSTTHCIAYALTEMMPPFEDYDVATKVLKDLFGTEAEKIAAILCGYIYVNLQPFDESFVEVLKKYSACPISNYILALYLDYERNIEEARKYIDISLALSHFPKNVLFKLLLYSSDLNDEQREQLKEEISGLVINKRYEQSLAPEGVVDLVDAYMKELVLGSYMTSINWENIKKNIASRTAG
jgi:hypothetical protein